MNREDRIRDDGLEEDKLFKTHKRLKCKWEWCRVASGMTKEEIRKKKSFQVSQTKVFDWNLEAIRWGSGYEARVDYGDEFITDKKGFKTRLDAQAGAEKLLLEWLKNEYSKIKWFWRGK